MGTVEEWAILKNLVGVILKYVPGCIVEIGCGVSTYILAEHAKSHGVKFYTCDTQWGKLEKIKKNIGYDNLIPFHGRSISFIETFNDTPSVVFIDGDHNAKVVRKEVNFFLDKLNIGGVLFLHDTCPWKETVESKQKKGRTVDTYLVRKELEQNKDFDVFTWRYTAAFCGLTMVLKKDMSEPEYRR